MTGIRLLGVGKRYSGSETVEALRPTNLQIGRGEFIAIVGPSGSGKTTLLNVLGLLDRPTSGRYEMFGVDTTRISQREASALRSQLIGFVFQDYHVLSTYSARENVELGLAYRAVPRRKRRTAALAALEDVGLRDRSNARVGVLSGGERQRVAVARAVVSSPTMLLCDEPTGNLDTATGQAIMGILIALNEQGITLVVVTHDDEIAGLADRVVRIRDGAVH